MNSLGQHITPVDFETLYITTERKEGRIHPDEEVAQLPVISSTHPHHKEWHDTERIFTKIDKLAKEKKETARHVWKLVVEMDGLSA